MASMLFQIKRVRTLVRIISYSVFAFAVAVGFAISGHLKANQYRMNIESSYQRAVNELSEHIDNIDLALRKGYYASTTTQLVGIASEIWSEAGAAKSNLSQLPFTTVNLDNTTKFISQVGDYANSLSRELASNQKISDSQRAQIKNLRDLSDKLSTQLGDLVYDIQAGKTQIFQDKSALDNVNASNVAKTSIEDGFENIEKNLAGLPSMIYDGPFSDSILRKEPLMTKGKPDVSKEQALKIAADFLGLDQKKLSYTGETAGVLPTYNFSSGSTIINITKAGGFPVRMIDSRLVASTALDTAAANSRAADFLQKRSILSMTETYYLTNNNICTVNFAYKAGDVTIYPDLIKLGVALDNGQIISFDATGYIMNHTSRSLPQAKVSIESVRQKLNPILKVNKTSLAVIPTEGGNEALCYELRCKSDDNQDVIEYFNTQTGIEQQLLIMLDTPGGSMPM